MSVTDQDRLDFLATMIEKHLPGRHEQKAHGHPGGGEASSESRRPLRSLVTQLPKASVNALEAELNGIVKDGIAEIRMSYPKVPRGRESAVRYLETAPTDVESWRKYHLGMTTRTLSDEDEASMVERVQAAIGHDNETGGWDGWADYDAVTSSREWYEAMRIQSARDAVGI